ncbi:MAG: hypothetical protein B9J98_07835 [Candidatus Terraquivivens tikiterensis]|uniref:Uncharacterized protein n=1 Tax=Candidatus Terraquivivens tikiterensis TaxID=1980982 RepID=A0A2R7Y0W3_9ARCH|nr:MAG: hypothetical protein B9J98_07835 [Candidatus Terraquivivens tikiterensis]
MVKFSADNLSPNEQLPSLQPVQISVLNFDAQTGELTVRREFSRMLTLKVSEEHVRNELLTSSESDFYALFLDNPKGFKIIGLLRSSRYRLLSRARELARIVVG